MSAGVHFTTALFVPGDRPERFAKASDAGADIVIVDLEDAVAADRREAARAALSAYPANRPLPFVRINGIGTPWHEDDVTSLAQARVAGIVLPKAELSSALPAFLQRCPEGISIVALIETARGIAEARSIAAHPGVSRLAFGSVDFCADIGCAHERAALAHARSELVLASRLASIDAPIDGVTTAIDDLALVSDDARYGRAMGFGGKLCIHPGQVDAVSAAYAPSTAEISWARKIVASGDGAAAIDGIMVDEPVRIRARKILASAAEP